MKTHKYGAGKCAFSVFISILLLLPLLTVPAQAVATDTLTVKVGYYGMAPEDYVEIATYTAQELYSGTLPLYTDTFSFFQGDAHDPDSIKTVVVTAYGFSLTDLLDHADIYTGDVNNVSFYTHDYTQGSFTGFGYWELFGRNRAYYENLAMYLEPSFNENGKITSVSYAGPEGAYVQPMLALEVNWTAYDYIVEEGSGGFMGKETPPNYDFMDTGRRFRLLFGQRDPMLSETRQSAHSVHSVYVTLDGQSIKMPGEPPEIDGAIGSHTVTMDMTVSNGSLLQAMDGLLGFSSSDDGVLKITDWRITSSDTFSDLMTVEISYDILAEGSATISGTIGGKSGTRVSLDGIDICPSEATGETASPEVGSDPDTESGAVPGEERQGMESITTQTPEESAGGASPVALPEDTPPVPIEAAEAQTAIPLTKELAQALFGAELPLPAEVPPAAGPERTQAIVHETVTDRQYIYAAIFGAAVLLTLGGAGGTLSFLSERKRSKK